MSNSFSAETLSNFLAPVTWLSDNSPYPIAIKDNKIKFLGDGIYYNRDSSPIDLFDDVYISSEDISKLYSFFEVVCTPRDLFSVTVNKMSILFESEQFRVGVPIIRTSHYDDDSEILLRPKLLNKFNMKVATPALYRAALMLEKFDNFEFVVLNRASDLTLELTTDSARATLHAQQPHSIPVSWNSIFAVSNIVAAAKAFASSGSPYVTLNVAENTKEEPSSLLLTSNESRLNIVISPLVVAPILDA